MSKDYLMEQAALYSLGALPEEEAREFAKVLASDEALRAYVKDLEETAASLAHAVPQQTVPPHLKSKILSAIAEEKNIVPFPGQTPPQTSQATHRFSIIFPWSLAACLAIFCGILAHTNQQIESQKSALQTRANTLESHLSQTELARGDLEKQLETATSAERLTNIKLETLTSQLNSSYIAAIAWNEKTQEGIMRVRKLPSAQPGKSYQLWVIDPKDPLPISAGVFTVASDGSAQIKFAPIRPVGTAKTFAVSLEKEGGSSTTPQGPIVLVN